jgi:hypothetical protein
VTGRLATPVLCERFGASTSKDVDDEIIDQQIGQFDRLNRMPAWSNEVTLLPSAVGSESWLLWSAERGSRRGG